MIVDEQERSPRMATCPTCDETGRFTHAGDQHIPTHIAEAMGLDLNLITLWHCPNCKSTISELDLHDV